MQDTCDRTRIETGVVSSILVIDDQTSREKRQLLRDVRLDAAQSSGNETVAEAEARALSQVGHGSSGTGGCAWSIKREPLVSARNNSTVFYTVKDLWRSSHRFNAWQVR